MLVIRLPGVTFSDESLPILGRDPLLAAGSKFIFDFADSYCWPSQAAPVANGQVVKNLVESKADASIYFSPGQAPGFAGGGLTFGVRAEEGVAIPDSVGMLASNNDGFLYSIWLKHGVQVNKASQSLVAGNTYQTGAENQYACAYLADTDVYRMYADGARNGDVTGIAVGQIVQLAIAYLPDGSGGHKVRLYKNGAPYLADAAAVGPLNIPVNIGRTNSIGRNSTGAGGFVQEWVGTVFRNWLEDLSVSQPNATQRAAYADAQVAKDYAQNVGRFS